MPRQSRSRPAARPAAPAPSHQQSRGAHTAAAQPPAHHAPPSQVPAQHAGVGQKQPGLLAQTMSTAAGVAGGSVIGHGISSMLFGGSSHAPVQEQPVQQQSFEERRMGGTCDLQAKDFTACLQATGNDASGACSYYLEALKACQQAAAQY